MHRLAQPGVAGQFVAAGGVVKGLGIVVFQRGVGVGALRSCRGVAGAGLAFVRAGVGDHCLVVEVDDGVLPRAELFHTLPDGGAVRFFGCIGAVKADFALDGLRQAPGVVEGNEGDERNPGFRIGVGVVFVFACVGLARSVLEAVGDAFFGQQALDEFEVGFAVLQAVGAFGVGFAQFEA